jgi:hypothetical protein
MALVVSMTVVWALSEEGYSATIMGPSDEVRFHLTVEKYNDRWTGLCGGRVRTNERQPTVWRIRCRRRCGSGTGDNLKIRTRRASFPGASSLRLGLTGE